MNVISRNTVWYIIALFVLVLSACKRSEPQDAPPDLRAMPVVEVALNTFSASSGISVSADELPDNQPILTDSATGWLMYEIAVPVAGRYRCEIRASNPAGNQAKVWVEDYVGNPDNRTYNITTGLQVPASNSSTVLSADGCPMDSGVHKIKLHYEGAGLQIESLGFSLMKYHRDTPKQLVQQTDGSEWTLAWSDEFEGDGLPDSTKWTYDIGNWGWGNNEPQYYTEKRIENARQENGNLIIEARKNDMGQAWTSARLTTREKVSFLYGKIEFRAKVPVTDGTWAAGWLLGDAYRDEISWPYCGEIDVLECVGHEIDDESGDGINHGSCHTRAFYFKEGNHITNILNVDDMTGSFHTYSIEWLPDGVRAFVDSTHYYTYDKLDGPLEWPFDQPQNLIVNLAMGGGMGGEIDPAAGSQQFILDYVRVYARK